MAQVKLLGFVQLAMLKLITVLLIDWPVLTLKQTNFMLVICSLSLF